MYGLKKLMARGRVLGLVLALLAPAICAATASTVIATSPAMGSPHAGCHDPAPPSPQTPSQEQKCCFAGRAPKAAVSERYLPPQADVLGNVTESTGHQASVVREAASVLLSEPTGPPGLRVLRI